jgi:hypothetical protein
MGDAAGGKWLPRRIAQEIRTAPAV